MLQLSTSRHNKMTKIVKIMSTTKFAVMILLKVGQSM